MASCGSLQGTLLLPPPNNTPKILVSAANVISYSAARNDVAWKPLSAIRCKSVRSVSALASSSTDDLRPELDENPEGIISGEWPENFSLLSYDDLRAYLETQIISDKVYFFFFFFFLLLILLLVLEFVGFSFFFWWQMKPTALLGDVMSTQIRTATADQTLEEIDHHFEVVSGLPVIDAELKCIGVVSKQDRAKASHGLKSKVGEVMSSPAITLTPDKTVLDAAALMLKMKIHRIPILNEKQRVVGMVTRTDIFRALETKVV
ncbi:CBS domain-containing protein [Cocos nucifera]|uniref:CBS domain-containing protein n=1 Tax=Cocos nucifera TaxID=13894 RepID=A0A8K0ILQ4_COCNU|nr:CBS domain-containing protein [Cocos nucifera]